MSYSAFDISRSIGQNLGAFQKETREQALIDQILSATNPQQTDYSQAISQILSQVSPERAQGVIGLLNQMAGKAQSREDVARRQAAYEAEGMKGTRALLPEGVQTQLAKQEGRLNLATKVYESVTGNKLDLSAVEETPQGTESISLEETFDQKPPTQKQKKKLDDLSDDELTALTIFDEFRKPAELILQKRREGEKEERADIRERRKETLEVKKDIANKAESARQSVRNKNELINIIDRGNLDDPTFAVFAENLPFNLGKRLLSDDSVTYKAATIDEYKDLRNLFQGQTRVAELDLLSEKIADLYLTDSQKKAVLKSRINALQADIAREQAALEVEEQYPNIGVLEFNKRVAEKTQEKLKPIFDQILAEQESIIEQAELKKKVPLSAQNPDDVQIIKQILIEAGGDKAKARKIAKEKGYQF